MRVMLQVNHQRNRLTWVKVACSFLFLWQLFVAGTSICQADDSGRGVGVTLIAGPPYSNDHGTRVNPNLEGVQFHFIGALACTCWENGVVFRAYSGFGLASVMMAQAGFGEGGGSVRIRSALPVKYCTGKNDGPLLPGGDERSRLAWVVKGYVDTFGNDVVYGFNVGLLY